MRWIYYTFDTKSNKQSFNSSSASVYLFAIRTKNHIKKKKNTPTHTIQLYFRVQNQTILLIDVSTTTYKQTRLNPSNNQYTDNWLWIVVAKLLQYGIKAIIEEPLFDKQNWTMFISWLYNIVFSTLYKVKQR